jgi:ATP-dependent protease ClpP protease subunit
MPNDILIYGTIYEYTARDFNTDMGGVVAGEDVNIRVNSDGGVVQDGWSIIARMNDFKGRAFIKVDGRAYSMAAFLCCYCDNVEALDVSEFMFHRAAYPAYYEQEMDDQARANLKRINANLRQAMEGKINADAFKEMTSCSMDDLFSMEQRKTVYLSAQQALELGLVSSIKAITPAVRDVVYSNIQADQARRAEAMNLIPKVVAIAPELNKPVIEKEILKINKMTKAELQAQHPVLFAEITNESVTAERDRAGAWLVFGDVDPKAVKEGVESGKLISQTQMAEFSLQASKTAQLDALKAGGTPPLTPAAPLAEMSEMDKMVNAVLELKTEDK